MNSNATRALLLGVLDRVGAVFPGPDGRARRRTGRQRVAEGVPVDDGEPQVVLHRLAVDDLVGVVMLELQRVPRLRASVLDLGTSGKNSAIGSSLPSRQTGSLHSRHVINLEAEPTWASPHSGNALSLFRYDHHELMPTPGIESLVRLRHSRQDPGSTSRSCSPQGDLPMACLVAQKSLDSRNGEPVITSSLQPGG